MGDWTIVLFSLNNFKCNTKNNSYLSHFKPDYPTHFLYPSNEKTNFNMFMIFILILYIKFIGVFVCLSGQFSGVARANTDLCLFFFWWVLFSMSVKLPGPLFFFFFWWVLFFVSVKLSGPLFIYFFDGFCFLCQLNCLDLCFFFDGFCFLCQLNCPDLFFFFDGFCPPRGVHYAPGSH